jgi:predicted DNA-binding protein
VSPSRGTPTTTTRIPPALKRRAQAKAARTGTTLTAVIVAALERYVEEET